MISLFARGFDRSTAAFIIIILGLAAAVPLLNLMMPPESPFHVPIYIVALWGKYAAYALLATLVLWPIAPRWPPHELLRRALA